MVQPRLRVLFGSEQGQSEEAVQTSPALKNLVSITLGDLARPLADAVHSQRDWVEDFDEEEILITPDLYELLRAYAEFRSEAA